MASCIIKVKATEKDGLYVAVCPDCGRFHEYVVHGYSPFWRPGLSKCQHFYGINTDTGEVSFRVEKKEV